MGNLQSAMEKLVDGLHAAKNSLYAAKTSRQNDLKEFRTSFQRKFQEKGEELRQQLVATHSAREEENRSKLSKTHAQRGKMAMEMRKKQTSNRKKRVVGDQRRSEGTQAFLTETRTSRSVAQSQLQQTFLSFRTSREKFGKEHKAVGRKVRKELGLGCKDLQTKIHGYLSNLCRYRKETLLGDLAAARSAWQNKSFAKLSTEKASAEKTAPEKAQLQVDLPQSDFQHSEANLPSEKEILAVLRKFPDGLKLADMGKEMGLSWRSLTGVVRLLVEKNRIEKVDGVYVTSQ